MALQDNFVFGDTSQYAVVVPTPAALPDNNYPMKYPNDGRLDQYLTGSGLENGGEVTYANITETSNVIKFGTSSFSVWNNGPTLSTILETICST